MLLWDIDSLDGNIFQLVELSSSYEVFIVFETSLFTWIIERIIIL